MPLRFAADPANGTSLVQTGLRRLGARPNYLSRTVSDFSSLQLADRHPVYDLRAEAVAGGGGLETATLSGVRYLVQDGSSPVAAAEVSLDGAGSATVLANLSYGPYVEATALALAEIATLDAVAAGSYEVRLLRFAAIYLMALWLRPDSGGADIIDPLAPAPPGLNAGQVYSPADLLQIIRPLAQERVTTGRIGIP
jgi:hypothetical protein